MLKAVALSRYGPVSVAAEAGPAAFVGVTVVQLRLVREPHALGEEWSSPRPSLRPRAVCLSSA